MNQDNLNMLACLENVGKKPVDILLELIQVEAYELDIKKSDFIKTLFEKLQKTYDITIPDILLEKWVKTKFSKKNNKLVLDACKEDIDSYIKRIRAKEEEFNKKIKEIRDDFKKYSHNEYNFSLTDGNVRDALNNYFYIDACYETSLSWSNPSEEGRKSKINFIFNQYMRNLYNENSQYLEVIENFGVANQIRKVVVNEGRDTEDKQFLENCEIYIDTPIMIKALGYDGKELADSYLKLLDALKEAGAKVCFFEHSFDEMWGVLFSFKKNIAQNFLDAKGVNQFLIAREEYRKAARELSLDENIVRENIKQLDCYIKPHINEKELYDNSDFSHWEFNEEKLTEIINNKYNAVSIYKSRIEKDVKSIAAISRLRKKLNIHSPTSYKNGCFFLLTDNYILLESLKSYYKSSEVSNDFQLNELIFENTILFDLWQNIFNNNTFNKALLRSKCFAFNEIDEKFKDTLYKICRKSDRYEPEKNMSEQFIFHPELQNKAYSQILKKGKYDEAYLKKVVNNIIQEKEEQLKKEIETKISDDTKKKENEYKQNLKEERERATRDIQNLINKKINTMKKSWFYRLCFLVRRLFNWKLTERTYYEFKAKQILGIE